MACLPSQSSYAFFQKTMSILIKARYNDKILGPLSGFHTTERKSCCTDHNDGFRLLFFGINTWNILVQDALLTGQRGHFVCRKPARWPAASLFLRAHSLLEEARNSFYVLTFGSPDEFMKTAFKLIHLSELDRSLTCLRVPCKRQGGACSITLLRRVDETLP